MSMAQDKSGTAPTAYIVMVLTPLFFSTNLIFGRGVSGDVAPFTLAFLRWSVVAIVLSPLVWQARIQIQKISAPGFVRICGLGFLGMWVCGALVYVALDYTTATNATLIYTTSSVMIILIEFLFYGRKSNWREAVGIVMAMAGIVVIVVKGSLELLLTLTLNPGDLIIFVSAFAWAGYSVLLRRGEIASIPTLPALAVVSAIGAVWLLPFAIWEFLNGQEMPATPHAWGSIAGIIVFASLLAFSGFQFGARHLGAPVAGIFMYMLPVYGVALAMIFLGERLEFHHLAGAALVMGGIMSATLPMRSS